jgi:hypothetical protein
MHRLTRLARTTLFTFALMMISLVAVNPAAAHAQQGNVLITKTTPAVKAAPSTEIHTFKEHAEGQIITTYADYKGCSVAASKYVVEIAADSLGVKQTATVWRTNDEVKAGTITFGGVQYDRTKGPDLINRMCTKMIGAIPDNEVRKLAQLVVVK